MRELRNLEPIQHAVRMSVAESKRTLLTIEEVAEQLRVSRSTIRRRIETGEIPALKLGRASQAPIRVDARESETWLYGSGVFSSSRPWDPAERRDSDVLRPANGRRQPAGPEA